MGHGSGGGRPGSGTGDGGLSGSGSGGGRPGSGGGGGGVGQGPGSGGGGSGDGRGSVARMIFLPDVLRGVFFLGAAQRVPLPEAVRSEPAPRAGVGRSSSTGTGTTGHRWKTSGR